MTVLYGIYLVSFILVLLFSFSQVGGSLAVSAVALGMKGRARMSTRAPRAAKRPFPVRFGKVSGENRGKVRGKGSFMTIIKPLCHAAESFYLSFKHYLTLEVPGGLFLEVVFQHFLYTTAKKHYFLVPLPVRVAKVLGRTRGKARGRGDHLIRINPWRVVFIGVCFFSELQ